MFGQAIGDQRLQLLIRHVLDAEDAPLAHFDQEHGLVFEFGGHGHRQDDFEDAIANATPAGIELNLDLGCSALEEDFRRVRHLDRQVLDVELFNGEDRLGVFVPWFSFQ